VSQLVALLQDLAAGAFVLLGVATALSWRRRRDVSMGWLALAIILLSLVSFSGRIAALISVGSFAVTEVSLFAFAGTAYALLRYRGSLIPLRRWWHLAAVGALGATLAAFTVSQLLVASGSAPASIESVPAILFLLAWAVAVTEPIVRFWLAARSVPPVQAWRLRSLSLGFGGLVAILAFAVGGRAVASQPAVQVVLQVAVICIVPILYVSFSPPAWLRRQWRAAEEQGLRDFMSELLVSEDDDDLSGRALEWALRLVGGESAVAFDADGKVRASRSVEAGDIALLKGEVPRLTAGISVVHLGGADRRVLMLPITGLAGTGSLVVLAGPFTPTFGGDEVNRIQQFMSAFVTSQDRRLLIEQLKESNSRLVEANRHKSVFLASMSHELRTPLNAILGFSELLMDSSDGQFPISTRKHFLEQIHSSGKHLLGLINDILDLSKIEAGQMELRLQAVSVPEIVAQVLATIEPLAVAKGINVSAGSVDAGEIFADPGKVRQMLLNLVANAIKFTPPAGAVVVGALRKQGVVELSVSDTGIGIDEPDQERVFHEFQQVDSGIGRQQNGTGLGLTLTRRFAHLHGGDVTLRSELGKGSVFTILLPIEARPPVVTPAAPRFTRGRRDAGDQRPLVLVVEDDPAAAELLMRQIEGAGFQATVARTGTEALASARELEPAAITLDILLPDLDGWEVLTRLKRDEATSNIPVVVVSVVDNPELGMALGALDYFVKPVPAKELTTRLAKFDLPRRPGERLTILVADDEDANRDWLCRILEPAGFSVIEAAGGREAIDLARARIPDLVLLDLMMPEVTGFDVVEALRDDAATRAIPIMVLTAKSLTESDIRQLNGHVSTILRRGSTGAADVLGLLRQVVLKAGSPG
jgi:signal transduction histidine kinase/DNA-binding response OmpR family regulator